MSRLLEYLVAHGYLFLFLFVVAEQVGLPTPALPVMLAAGALARHGDLHFGGIVAVSLVGCWLADGIWYEAGRRRGAAVLSRLCRLSLEPDSCVRRTEGAFQRWGALTLIVAKYVPGLNTVAPPMAGALGMSVARFLLVDTLGALVWVLGLAGTGYVFADGLERVVEQLVGFGKTFVVVAALGLALYVAFKLLRRRRILREIAVARISPQELKGLIDSGPAPLIVDLRHRLEALGDPHTIPGAIHVPVEDLGGQHERIPLDREIVLFCT